MNINNIDGVVRDIDKIRICIFVYQNSDHLVKVITAVLSQEAQGDFTYLLTIFDLTDDRVVLSVCEQFIAKHQSNFDYRKVITTKNISFLKNVFLSEQHNGYTVFLDQNCVPCDGWLKSFYSAMLNGADVTCGPVLVDCRPDSFLCRHATNRVSPSCPDNYIIRNASVDRLKLRFDTENGQRGRDTILFFKDINLRGLSVHDVFTAKVFQCMDNSDNFGFILRCCLFDFFRGLIFAFGDFRISATFRDSKPSFLPASDTILTVPFRIKKKINHICVCIITYKRIELLRKLLTSLISQVTDGLFTYSLVIVDNDSLASAKHVVDEFIRDSKLVVQYFVEPVKNIALARNISVKHAHGDYVAFIDDDEYPHQRWLINLFMMANMANADIVGGPVMPVWGINVPSLFMNKLYSLNYARAFDGDSRTTLFSTNNAMVRLEYIKKFSFPFDEYFGLMGGSDTVFFHKAKRDGAIFAWSSSAIVYEYFHEERYHLSWVLRRFYRYGNNAANMFLLQYGRVRLFGFIFIRGWYLLFHALLQLFCIFSVSCKFSDKLALAIYWFSYSMGYLAGSLGIKYYEYK